MTRTLTIALIVVAFLAFLAGAWWFYTSVIQDGGGTGPGQQQDGDGGFFPFGEPPSDAPGGGSPGTTTPPDTEPQAAPVFRQVTDAPIAGAAIRSGENGADIRYIRRDNGHVYRGSSTTTATERLSNTTIPKIQEVVWPPDTSYFIARYLTDDGESIRTFSGEVADGQTEGTFLRGGITDVTTHPDGSRLMRIEEDGGGVRAVATDRDGANPVSVFENDLSHWDVEWESDDELILSTHSAANVPGAAYAYDLNTGTMEYLLGPWEGLSLNAGPNGRYVLYTTNENGTMSLFLYDRQEDAYTDLPLQTFAEKCEWSNTTPGQAYCAVPNQSPGQGMPDAWYQGSAFFTDSLWRIDAEREAAEFLFDASERANASIDAIDLDIADDDSLLIFRNKRDLSLWALDLTRL